MAKNVFPYFNWKKHAEINSKELRCKIKKNTAQAQLTRSLSIVIFGDSRACLLSDLADEFVFRST